VIEAGNKLPDLLGLVDKIADDDWGFHQKMDEHD
jgi:hypothetical protein